MRKKILIIRFSSIGDILQSLSLPQTFIEAYPDAEIHFLTKKEFSLLIDLSPHVNRLWAYDKRTGIKGLLQLLKQLRAEKFDIIYDAHNNLRSSFLKWFTPASQKSAKSTQRWKRFLLLNFKINLFEKPFSGQRDLYNGLHKLGLDQKLPEAPVLKTQDEEDSLTLNKLNLKSKSYIALAPSAAHRFKKWPLEYWKTLIRELPQITFVILAGPNDHFTQELNDLSNVINLTGKTNLKESAIVVKNSILLISNDTGLLHVAEQFSQIAIALMGAAPFGYPSRKSTLIMEHHPKCWPCSKHGQGPCSQKIYHECMVMIKPDQVLKNVIKKLY